jgi:hypothetical protein
MVVEVLMFVAGWMLVGLVVAAGFGVLIRRGGERL